MHSAQLPEARLTCNPAMPMPKGQRVNINSPGMAFLYRYSTAPTSNSLTDIQYHEDVIGGLSRLDADCNLSKKVRKAGRHLHAVIEVRRLR